MFLTKRHGIYYLCYEDDFGKRHIQSTRSRLKSQAVEFVRSFNMEQETKRRSLSHVTIAQFAETYVAYSQKVNTRDTASSNRTALAEFARFVGEERMLSKITTGDCERFLAKKSTDASLWTARKYYLALHAAFQRAVTWEHLMENPWHKVRKPKPPEVLPVFFTREQIRTLIAAISDEDMRELVAIGVLTGLRRRELLSMTWDWIDFTRRVLVVKNTSSFTTKSKHSRMVPLCPEVLTILLARHERLHASQSLVFARKGKPMDEDYVTHQFKAFVRGAGLPEELHFHSMRHGFASWLVQGGVSLFQVGKLLGHSSTHVTEIYAHLVPSDMHGILGPLHLGKKKKKGKPSP